MIFGTGTDESDRKKGTVISIDFSHQERGKKNSAKNELEQAMLANRRNQERQRKRRAETNKSVLRTYRLKKNEKK